jgi:hypothetical protein
MHQMLDPPRYTSKYGNDKIVSFLVLVWLVLDGKFRGIVCSVASGSIVLGFRAFIHPQCTTDVDYFREHSSAFKAKEQLINELMLLGFDRRAATEALMIHNNDRQLAVNYLLDHRN